MTVMLDGECPTVEDVGRVARGGELVKLGSGVIERMRESRRVVETVLRRGDAVYGMTTGLGQDKRYRVTPERVEEFNRRLIESHRVGHGPAAPSDVVRATMLRMANGFAKATVGVRRVRRARSDRCSLAG
jgi:histidine ammonia-lyase